MRVSAVHRSAVSPAGMSKARRRYENSFLVLSICLVSSQQVFKIVSFHKVSGVEEAIQTGGASLRYLPQYSPDLNPIELVFHPLKTALRKAAERTIEGLVRRARSFIRTLDPVECLGYFRRAGYEPL